MSVWSYLVSLSSWRALASRGGRGKAGLDGKLLAHCVACSLAVVVIASSGSRLRLLGSALFRLSVCIKDGA